MSSDRSSSSAPNINQTHLKEKMKAFLEAKGEIFPVVAYEGLCNAYVYMLTRATLMGQRAAFFERLEYLAQLSQEEMKQMAQLNKAYQLCFQSLVKDEKNQELLRQKLAETSDKLEKEKAQAEFYHELRKEVFKQLHWSETDKTHFFKGQDLDFFISSLIFSFHPGLSTQLILQDKPSDNLNREISERGRLATQSDFIDIHRFLMLDGLKLPLIKAFSLGFTFTPTELSQFLGKTLQEGDMLRLDNGSHVVQLSYYNSQYFLYDPNNPAKPTPLTDVKELTQLICESFLRENKNHGCLALGIDIYQAQSTASSRPTPKMVREEIIEGRVKAKGDPNLNIADPDGITALYIAARHGDFETVDFLLKQGADPRLAKTDKSKLTPLIAAIMRGYGNIVQAFLDKSPPETTDLLSLNVAATFGHVHIIEQLEKMAEKLKLTVDRSSAIQLAALQGRFEVVNYFLAQDPKLIKTINAEQQSLLHLCAINGNRELFEYLLQKGLASQLQVEDNHGYNPFHLALKSNNYALAAFLLRSLPSSLVSTLINAPADPTQKISPLQLAVKNGNVELAELLLLHGANPNLQDNDGNTALHLASIQGDEKLVQLLLTQGAAINLANQEGKTALHCAVEKRLTPIVDLLLEKNPDLEATTRVAGFTPLHIAIFMQNTPLVEKLLLKQASLETRTKAGQSVLHLLENLTTNPNALMEISALLFQHGAVKLIHEPDKQGKLPIDLALQRSHVLFINLLVEKGAKIPLSSQADYRLHAMARSGNTVSLQTLLDGGFPIDQRNEQDETALIVALKNKNIMAADFLISKGADLHCIDENGNTVLHLAVENKFIDLVRLLLTKSLAVNLANKEGMTSIHYAAKNNDLPMIMALINADADPGLTNNKHQTAYDLATENGFSHKMIMLFKKRNKVKNTTTTTTTCTTTATTTTTTTGSLAIDVSASERRVSQSEFFTHRVSPAKNDRVYSKTKKNKNNR